MSDLEKPEAIAKWVRNDQEKSGVIAKWNRSDLEKSGVIAKWTRNDHEKSGVIAKWIRNDHEKSGVIAKWTRNDHEKSGAIAKCIGCADARRRIIHVHNIALHFVQHILWHWRRLPCNGRYEPAGGRRIAILKNMGCF